MAYRPVLSSASPKSPAKRSPSCPNVCHPSGLIWPRGKIARRKSRRHRSVRARGAGRGTTRRCPTGSPAGSSSCWRRSPPSTSRRRGSGRRLAWAGSWPTRCPASPAEEKKVERALPLPSGNPTKPPASASVPAPAPAPAALTAEELRLKKLKEKAAREMKQEVVRTAPGSTRPGSAATAAEIRFGGQTRSFRRPIPPRRSRRRAVGHRWPGRFRAAPRRRAPCRSTTS